MTPGAWPHLVHMRVCLTNAAQWVIATTCHMPHATPHCPLRDSDTSNEATTGLARTRLPHLLATCRACGRYDIPPRMKYRPKFALMVATAGPDFGELATSPG